MSNPTINTPQVRPVPYVRSSRPSLERLQGRIAPVAGVTVAAAASTWVVGDRAPGRLAAVVAGLATVGTLAIAAGPVVSILHDARDGHAPRDEDLAPVIAAAAAAYATAAWSGLWIQLVVLVLGSIAVAALVTNLVNEARVQLGQGVEW